MINEPCATIYDDDAAPSGHFLKKIRNDLFTFNLDGWMTTRCDQQRVIFNQRRRRFEKIVNRIFLVARKRD